MVSLSQSIAALSPNKITGRNGIIDRYFYFAMSLLVAAIVVWGFSHTINESLFHPAIPRPFLLWIHGAAFAAWPVLYIFRSALIRTRNVKIHRNLGWFGAALAATMVVLGFSIAVIMGRFDKHTLHQANADTFLSIPFADMLFFAIFVGLAIYWRKQPELHRRLLFIATCCLLDAPFGRIDYLNNNSLFYLCLDAVILLGPIRDLLVNRRIHKVYLVTLPPMFAMQAFIVYLWRGAPAWWQHLGQSILG